MAKAVKEKQPSCKNGWVFRSASNGRIVSVHPTKEEALARARFLAAASLSIVPKKSQLTQTQAKAAVKNFLRDMPDQATGH